MTRLANTHSPELVYLQRGAFIGPGGAAGKPGCAGQVGGADPGRREGRHGGAGAYAVGTGLRPLGQPSRVPRAARAQGTRRSARRPANSRRAPALDTYAHVHIVSINGLHFVLFFIVQAKPDILLSRLRIPYV